jgi:hypothetical protein
MRQRKAGGEDDHEGGDRFASAWSAPADLSLNRTPYGASSLRPIMLMSTPSAVTTIAMAAIGVTMLPAVFDRGPFFTRQAPRCV